MTIELIIEPNGSTKWHAWANDGYLGSFRTPLLSGARKLMSYGVDPAVPLTMRHKGAAHVAMPTTVGAAAKLAVREDRRGGPAFVTYRNTLDSLCDADV